MTRTLFHPLVGSHLSSSTTKSKITSISKALSIERIAYVVRTHLLPPCCRSNFKTTFVIRGLSEDRRIKMASFQFFSPLSINYQLFPSVCHRDIGSLSGAVSETEHQKRENSNKPSTLNKKRTITQQNTSTNKISQCKLAL